MVAIACIDKQGHIAIVLKRTKTRTIYIATSKKKRKIIKADNRLFCNDYSIIANNPVTIAEKWLSAPINMTQEVRKRLEMIIAMKKNNVVAKCEDLSQVPEGTDVITSAEDLQGRSLKSLNALYVKVSGEEVKFENAEAASLAIWGAFESFELGVKEKSVKAGKEPKAKMELIELPKSISKDSVITGMVEENPRREGTTGHTNFSNYVVGETLGEYLAKEGAHMGHFRWDVERGFITADIIEQVKVEKKSKKEVTTEE